MSTVPCSANVTHSMFAVETALRVGAVNPLFDSGGRKQRKLEQLKLERTDKCLLPIPQMLLVSVTYAYVKAVHHHEVIMQICMFTVCFKGKQ